MQHYGCLSGFKHQFKKGCHLGKKLSLLITNFDFIELFNFASNHFTFLTILKLSQEIVLHQKVLINSHSFQL